jgi:hypothetical protein
VFSLPGGKLKPADQRHQIVQVRAAEPVAVTPSLRRGGNEIGFVSGSEPVFMLPSARPLRIGEQMAKGEETESESRVILILLAPATSEGP